MREITENGLNHDQLNILVKKYIELSDYTKEQISIEFTPIPWKAAQEMEEFIEKGGLDKLLNDFVRTDRDCSESNQIKFLNLMAQINELSDNGEFDQKIAQLIKQNQIVKTGINNFMLLNIVFIGGINLISYKFHDIIGKIDNNTDYTDLNSALIILICSILVSLPASWKISNFLSNKRFSQYIEDFVKKGQIKNPENINRKPF